MASCSSEPLVSSSSFSLIMIMVVIMVVIMNGDMMREGGPLACHARRYNAGRHKLVLDGWIVRARVVVVAMVW